MTTVTGDLEPDSQGPESLRSWRYPRSAWSESVSFLDLVATLAATMLGRR